jgi:hypothetical protein
MKSNTSKVEHFLSIAIFFLLTSLFIVSCTNQPVAPTPEEAGAAIWKKIEIAGERWASGDPMGYIECAADDISWMDDLAAFKPVVGKDALTAYLEGFKGKIPPHKHELQEKMFQFYEDIVVVTYRYQGVFDTVAAPPWKVSSVYRYVDDDWLSVHENWTLVEQQ